MDYKIFKNKINQAFRNLRSDGYIAKQNLMCCQSCGWAEIGDGEDAERAVFYSQQDVDKMKNEQMLLLSWSGDGYIISDAFHAVGLSVTWSGAGGERIKVYSPR